MTAERLERRRAAGKPGPAAASGPRWPADAVERRAVATLVAYGRNARSFGAPAAHQRSAVQRELCQLCQGHRRRRRKHQVDDIDPGLARGLDRQAVTFAQYPSGEGRLFAEDVIVNIEGAAGTMIVSV